MVKQDAIILCSIFLENMARSLNSRCDFENAFFTCDLPEDFSTSDTKGQNQDW